MTRPDASPDGAAEPSRGEFYQSIVEDSPDGVFALSEDLELTLVNRAIESLVGIDRDRIVGRHASVFKDLDVVNADEYERAIEACRAVLERGDGGEQFEIRLSTDTGSIVAEYRVEAVQQPDVDAALVGTIRDISPRVHRQEHLARQRTGLSTLSGIQSLVLEIIQSLSSTATKVEVNRRVCDGLVQSTFYDVAWIGSRGPREAEFETAAAAGLERPLEDLLASAVGPLDASSLLVETFETGRMQVVTDPSTDPRLSPSVRERLLQCDSQSWLALPLSVGETVTAVLLVGTVRGEAFRGREQMALEVLGEFVEFAVRASEARQLLQSARAVELEFRLAERSPAARLTEALGCTWTLDAVLPDPDAQFRCVATIEGATADESAEWLETHADVERLRVVREWDDGARLDVALSEYPLQTITASGIRLQAARASEGVTFLTVRIGPSRSPREVIDLVRSVYHDVELLRREPVEGAPPTRADVDQWLTEDLTMKQRLALEGAYTHGYFNWPRDNTAQEIAEAFDISSATFHAHLRKANRKVLSAIFDDQSPPDADASG